MTPHYYIITLEFDSDLLYESNGIFSERVEGGDVSKADCRLIIVEMRIADIYSHRLEIMRND